MKRPIGPVLLVVALAIAGAWWAVSSRPARREATRRPSIESRSIRSPWAVGLTRRSGVVSSVAASGRAVTALLGGLRQLEEDDNPEQRDDQIARVEKLLDAIDHGDLRARLEIVAALPAGDRETALALPWFEHWSRVAPADTLDWLRAQQLATDARVLTILQRWASADPESMPSYLGGATGPWRDQLATAAVYANLEASAARSTELARQVQDPGLRDTLVRLAVAEWGKSDPLGAARWVAGESDADERARLTASLLASFADVLPEVAQASGAAVTGVPRDVATAEMAGNLAKTDPVAALAQLEALGEGPVKDVALGTIVREWSARDGRRLRAWIAGLPESEWRSRAERFAQAAAVADEP